ncbi:MAG: hypothetical protein KDA42_01575 [Planctomycetales bacterium]|nr:hypothetical protein [Planctomycetales bacterium]
MQTRVEIYKHRAVRQTIYLVCGGCRAEGTDFLSFDSTACELGGWHGWPPDGFMYRRVSTYR